MIDFKDLDNAEAVELEKEEQREIIGAYYGYGKQGSTSTVMDVIYEAAWRKWWY
jgi:hypothetical protein